MKHLLVVIISLSFAVFNNAQAQKTKKQSDEPEVVYQFLLKDSITGKYKYEELIKSEGITQINIFDRAKDWVVRTLKSADNMVNLDDANKESITATGNILLDDQLGFVGYREITLNFKLSVYCKEGRYKIIIDNFILNYIYDTGTLRAPRTVSLEDGFKKEGAMTGKKQMEKVKAEADAKIKKMLEEIKSAIATGTMPGDKGDW